jgi:hypothetical protein
VEVSEAHGWQTCKCKVHSLDGPLGVRLSIEISINEVLLIVFPEECPVVWVFS